MHALDSSTVAYECGCGLIHPGSSQRALNGGTYNGNETEEWENAKGTHRPCRWERLSAIPSSRPSGRRAPRSRVARAEWRPDPPRRGRDHGRCRASRRAFWRSQVSTGTPELLFLFQWECSSSFEGAAAGETLRGPMYRPQCVLFLSPTLW
jgi:hypothetical protein